MDISVKSLTTNQLHICLTIKVGFANDFYLISPSLRVKFCYQIEIWFDTPFSADNELTNIDAEVFLFIDAKRLIGRRFTDETVQNDIKLWPFKVISDTNDWPIIVVTYEREEKQFAPEEISSMILTKMKHIAETYIGSEVNDAVVTVPAYFDHSQRHATMNAGKIAGLNVLRIINEPTAAAIAYGFDKSSSITGKRNVLIFDLGGGTFDVSILAIESSKIEVKGTAGDTHLGGEDFDARLVDHFIKVFSRKHNKDINGNPKSIRRLRTACERAKRILSSSAETRIDIDSLFEGIDFSATITRPKFEELNSDLFLKCIGTVEKCLTDSQMNKNTIDDVVMVGGSSRIPKVQQMLQDLLDGKKVCRDINPDEAVAYGAAIQAAMLSGQDNKKMKQLELVEITPLSLGIETSGQTMDVVIPRNTIIPARGVHELTTIIDNQSCARVKVFEGERVRSIDNKFLGEFLLPAIQMAPRGVPKIDIYFDLEANGLLTVTVKEVDTGHEKSFNVTCGRLSRDEIDSVIKEANKNQVEDKEYRKRSDARSVFERFTCDMRDHINKSNMSSAEKKKAEDATKNAFQWLDETHDQLAEVRDYEEKTKELARVCNPGRPSPFRKLIKLIGRNRGHQRK
ncbi:OLC1v1027649C2 [Oldenlandia corymbosa var. corymbosa]|uniref:OLC1v1027649C2 n=1 Tax=Oldenlandia corymbosa var. corymbosa TaxID=529605 RepID=A0AAV1CAG7_OLDCO|nr:OLC1v1027649C2 [Oldenlandia corymbosa var. corymbosa]